MPSLGLIEKKDGDEEQAEMGSDPHVCLSWSGSYDLIHWNSILKLTEGLLPFHFFKMKATDLDQVVFSHVEKDIGAKRDSVLL